MTSKYKSIFFAVSLLFLAGAISSPWAHAGAKSIFNGIPTVTDCRICHGDTDFTVLLHHDLIGTVIPEGDESTAPDAPDAVPGDLYECMSCHDMANILDCRDCLQCHPVWIVTGSPGGRGDNVHHDTFNNCIICHSN